jgi:putative membrane protein
MSVRSRISYFATVGIMCGIALAQFPAGSQAPGNPMPGAPSSPGVNSPTYPGAGPLGTQPEADVLVSDKAFVKKAAEETVTEVELAKLAQEKGSSEAVKEFGKRVVDDHSKSGQDLAAAAAKVNVEVPSELPRGGKKTRDKLARLSGPDFDRAYAKLMLSDQKDDMEFCTQEARLGKIPEVKDFAAKNLPAIQQRRKMAEDLEAGTKK